MEELCYRNNSESLFRKFAPIVTAFANTQLGRDYLYDGQHKMFVPDKKQRIELFLPNGHKVVKDVKNYKGQDSPVFQYVFSTRAIFSPKLTPALQFLNAAVELNAVRDFDEALKILLYKTGLRTRLVDIPDAAFGMFLTTTGPVYPDADPETTTTDGAAAREGVDQTLTAIRAGAGTNTYPTSSLLHCWYLAASGTASQYSGLYRFIALFDASAIPDGEDVIDGSKASFYGRSRVEDLGALATALVASTPASNTDVAAADYSQLGSTRLASDLATWPTAQYNDLALNTAGKAAVSKTGITKLGTRCANDVDNSTTGIGWGSGLDCNAGTRTADFADVTSDPKLTIISAPAGFMFAA